LMVACAGVISPACESIPMKKDVVSVQVRVVHPRNETAPTLVTTFDEHDRRTKVLADALQKCGSSDPLKFKPKYQLTVRYSDNSEQMFSVLGNHVKIEGVTNRCEIDLEALIDKLST